MRLFQKGKRLGTWDPQALDFSSDGADWAAFGDTERDFLLRTLTLFQWGLSSRPPDQRVTQWLGSNEPAHE